MLLQILASAAIFSEGESKMLSVLENAPSGSPAGTPGGAREGSPPAHPRSSAIPAGYAGEAFLQQRCQPAHLSVTHVSIYPTILGL